MVRQPPYRPTVAVAAGLALGLSLMSLGVRAQERAVKIGFVTSEAVCWRTRMRNSVNQV